MGLGLSQYIPYVIYGLSFVVALTALIYRRETGIIFIAFFLPIYALLHKTLKLDLPLANDTVDFILIGIILGGLVQSGREDHRPAAGQSPQIWPILLFAGYSLISYLSGTFHMGGDFMSEVNINRLSDWKNYMIIPLLYILTYYGLKERKWKYALFMLLFVSFLVMDIKFKETFRWFQHTRYTHADRVDGTLGFLNGNAFAALHVIWTLFLVSMFLMDKHFRRRVAYGLLIVGGIFCILYSYSRGAYVGFAAGLVFIALVRSRKLLIPLFLFLLVWKMVVPSSVVDRIEGTFVEQSETTGVISIGNTNLETAYRSEIWKEALSIFSDNPIMGTGFRTFYEKTGWDTHNQYLKTLSEQGVIGLFIYLLLYQRAFMSGWRLYKSGDEDLLKAFGFSFVCAVVGSMVVNFFGDRWTYLQLGGLYWIVWALVDQENSRIALQRQTEDAELEAMGVIGGEGSVAEARVQGSKGSSELAQNI